MPAFLIKSNQQFDISRNSFDKYLANLAITFKNTIIKPDWMNCCARGLRYNSRARREMLPVWKLKSVAVTLRSVKTTLLSVIEFERFFLDKTCSKAVKIAHRLVAVPLKFLPVSSVSLSLIFGPTLFFLSFTTLISNSSPFAYRK